MRRYAESRWHKPIAECSDDECYEALNQLPLRLRKLYVNAWQVASFEERSVL